MSSARSVLLLQELVIHLGGRRMEMRMSTLFPDAHMNIVEREKESILQWNKYGLVRFLGRRSIKILVHTWKDRMKQHELCCPTWLLAEVWTPRRIFAVLLPVNLEGKECRRKLSTTWVSSKDTSFYLLTKELGHRVNWWLTSFFTNQHLWADFFQLSSGEGSSKVASRSEMENWRVDSSFVFKTHPRVEFAIVLSIVLVTS